MLSGLLGERYSATVACVASKAIARGVERGVRILTHDHANEQPFTRSLSGVRIPAGVRGVRVQGRDQVSGWGGRTVEVDLPD